MYTREQSALIKQSFWKSFGQYMALQPSAEGGRIHWINYRTGIRYLSFKMETNGNLATVAIELSHPDSDIRALMMEQFRQVKNLLDSYLEDEWTWQELAHNDQGQELSRISTSLSGFSIFRQEDWPELVRFFKKHITALDAFWTDARYAFDLFA